MRKLTLFLAVFAMSAAAQQEWSPETHLDGGVSQTLQSIYIPPIHDAPFAASVHTEWVRPMAGGGTATLVNSRRVMRDRDGRIYEERWALVPKTGNVKSVRNVIQIYDVNEGTGYDCWLLGPKHGVCQLLNYTPKDSNDAPSRPGRTLTGNGYQVHEDLGIKTIEGIEVVGSRDTRIVNAGAMGNDQEMRIVREYWHSPKLGLNLVSILTDPRIGTETFTLSDIAVTEVDPKYFQIPEGFTIEDRRTPPEK